MFTTMPSMLDRWHPSKEQPWELRRVWHLHRRAGFAGTWAEIQRDLRDGPDLAIARLLDPTTHAASSSDRESDNAFEQMSSVICDAAVSSSNINRLKAWWLYRMLFTPDPVGERLTLTWHNHFATSYIKVEDVGLMRKQNDLLRRGARGSFAELLRQMVKNPALLIFLDADANRKEHPNENLARESMELFSLGVGNYSEDDVKGAARALTGWTVKNGEFQIVADRHDAAEKTIFGRTGAWNGDDFVQMLVEHPATSRRLASRICGTFMGESTTSDSLIDELANGLRAHDLNIAWGVETLLSSDAFFADENIGNRIMSPVEFVIGAARALEYTNPSPSTLLLAEWTTRLGQDLFTPPNVFGWPGGRSWLTSRALVGRTNFATGLVTGQLTSDPKPVDARSIAEKYGYRSDDDVRAFFAQVLLGRTELPEPLRQRDMDSLVLSMLMSPEAQLA